VVAQAERTGRLLKVDIRGRGIVAVRDSDASDARFRPEGFLTGIRRDGCRPHLEGNKPEVSAVVEVQRRFGGLAPRALLGGSLTVANSGEVAIRIAYGDGGDSTIFPSELWSHGFTVGLPKSFASAVLQTFLSRDDVVIPCGNLVIEQAGFDPIESASPVFSQAAVALASVLNAVACNSSVEESVTRAIESWF
jgi:hypothetical protein